MAKQYNPPKRRVKVATYLNPAQLAAVDVIAHQDEISRSGAVARIIDEWRECKPRHERGKA